MHIIRIIAVSMILWLTASISASAADSAAGRNIFTADCSGCHQPKSFAGKTSAELETELKSIVAGTKEHPMKLTLSPSNIADVSAFISQQ
jgi:mono/diheme cytochrome c family protein